MGYRPLDAAIGVLWLLLSAVDVAMTAALVAWRGASAAATLFAAPAGPRKEVVVVGASFAGLAAQRLLRGRFSVTLVDYKQYFEYVPGALRCFIEPGFFPELSCPLPRNANRLVTGEVTRVSPTAVTVRNQADGSTSDLRFDYLVLAMGSLYQDPVKPTAKEPTAEARQRTWDAAARALDGATGVVIVGAGAVGVELAGEILTAHPGKRVTIVDKADTILPGFKAKSVAYAMRWLQRAGAELRLGQGISSIGATSVTLEDGKVLSADIVYKCIGVQPNTAAMKESFSSTLGFRDSITVNDHLQISGHPKIYCVGDMMSHASRELKLGHTAELNAHCAAENVLRADEGRPLMVYPDDVVGAKKTPVIYCLSLGKYDATLGFNNLVISGFLAALTKWLLEWTKVQAARERPIGEAFWWVADHMSLLLGRTVFRP